MSDSSWATVASALAFLAALAWLAWDRRALTQKLRDAEGSVAGLRLDLGAVTDRLAELQTYLSDPESWRTEDARPVPAALTDPVPPDRWSPAVHLAPEPGPAATARRHSDAAHRTTAGQD